MEIEAKMGATEDQLVVTVTMSPEERALVKQRHAQWTELVETTMSFDKQPRSIYLNSQNRHVALGELMRLLRPMTMDPIDLRDEEALQPSAPLGRWAWLRAKVRTWWRSRTRPALPASSA